MDNREEFEKALSAYAADHITGSVGLVRKIGKHFYDVRQPEIDALETENKRLSDSLEAIDLDTKALVEEIETLKAEVSRLQKELSVMDIAQECLDADKEEE